MMMRNCGIGEQNILADGCKEFGGICYGRSGKGCRRQRLTRSLNELLMSATRGAAAAAACIGPRALNELPQPISVSLSLSRLRSVQLCVNPTLFVPLIRDNQLGNCSELSLGVTYPPSPRYHGLGRDRVASRIGCSS